MLNAPLVVSRIFGGPALRPAPPIWTSFVGVKISFVLKDWREMSVKFPTTVAAGAGSVRSVQRVRSVGARGKRFIKYSVFSVQYSVFRRGVGPRRGFRRQGCRRSQFTMPR